MKNLSKLLERFSRSLNKDVLVKSFIIEIVKKTTGLTLEEKALALKDGVLSISSRAVWKNEIKLKETQILEELWEKHGVRVSRVLYK